MPIYNVKAFEMFEFITQYQVEAESEDMAIDLCKRGDVGPWDREGTDEGEWIETISIEEQVDNSTCKV